MHAQALPHFFTTRLLANFSSAYLARAVSTTLGKIVITRMPWSFKACSEKQTMIASVELAVVDRIPNIHRAT